MSWEYCLFTWAISTFWPGMSENSGWRILILSAGTLFSINRIWPTLCEKFGLRILTLLAGPFYSKPKMLTERQQKILAEVGETLWPKLYFFSEKFWPSVSGYFGREIFNFFSGNFFPPEGLGGKSFSDCPN